MIDAKSQLTTLFDTPAVHWAGDEYFPRRNRQKLDRALTKLRREIKGGDAVVAERLLAAVDERRKDGISSLMVMSNGGSGCHHLGLLLDALPGYSLTDEVYFPTSMLRAAEERNGDLREIEALDLAHVGTLRPPFHRDHVVNIGHLRSDATPTRLRRHLPNARFILLLRDPIAVAISRAFRKADFRAQSGHADTEDLEYLERQASFTAAHFNRALGFEWDAVVRYENLVRDPIGTVGDLLRQLGHDVPLPAVAVAVRSSQQGKKAAEADNRNVAIRAEIKPDQAAVLAQHLAWPAYRWGYALPEPVAVAAEELAGATGRPRFWRPFLAGFHASEEGYERLRAGRLKVHRNLPETELPVDDPNWVADPLGNNATWRLFYHSLGWLLARSWAVDQGVDVEDNLQEIERVVFSHISSNVEQAADQSSAWDDHATGDRLAHLAILYHDYLRQRLSPSQRRRFLAAIETHVERIAAFRHDGRWVDSNHGAFHALGAINAGLALGEHPIGRRAMEVGTSYLNDVVHALVGDDGVAVEQSVAYHTINISLLRGIQRVVATNNIDIGIDIAELCARMVEFNYATRGRSGQRPSIGDTPHGTRHPSTGLELKGAEHATPRVAYIRSAGAEGEPFPSPTLFTQAGLAVLRHGEPELGDDVVSRAVVSFQGARIHHGHHDQLSMTFVVDDHTVLVDPGGPYSYSDPLRFSFFVAARGHNTVLIDDREHRGSGRLLDDGSASGVSWVTVSHDGYDPVVLRRTVALIDGDVLVVFDRADDTTGAHHDFTTLWHFAPEAAPELTADRRAPLVLALPHTSRPMVLGSTTAGDHAEIVRGVAAGTDRRPQGWVTRDLGSLEPAPVLQARSTGVTHRAITWIAPAGRAIVPLGDGRLRVDRSDGGALELADDGIRFTTSDPPSPSAPTLSR